MLTRGDDIDKIKFCQLGRHARIECGLSLIKNQDSEE
jgi:hypothetical protein